jgi:DNA-binding response OmpR family regulator
LKAAALMPDLDGPLIDCASKGSKVELIGTEKIGDRDTYKLALTSRDGQVQHIWVDSMSYLEVKIEGSPRRLDGKLHPVVAVRISTGTLFPSFRSAPSISNPSREGSIIVAGDLQIDISDRSGSRAGVPLALSLQEFSLLEYLIRNKGKVVSREMLAREVWNTDHRQAPLDNIIDVTVSRLRRKIDEPFDWNLLQTIRGVGYKILEQAP